MEDFSSSEYERIRDILRAININFLHGKAAEIIRILEIIENEYPAGYHQQSTMNINDALQTLMEFAEHSLDRGYYNVLAKILNTTAHCHNKSTDCGTFDTKACLSFVHTLFSSRSFEIISASLRFISSVVKGSCESQEECRKSGCLQDVLFLYKKTVTNRSMEIRDTETLIELIMRAISSLTRCPENKENQRFCTDIILKSFKRDVITWKHNPNILLNLVNYFIALDVHFFTVEKFFETSNIIEVLFDCLYYNVQPTKLQNQQCLLISRALSAALANWMRNKVVKLAVEPLHIVECINRSAGSLLNEEWWEKMKEMAPERFLVVMLESLEIWLKTKENGETKSESNTEGYTVEKSIEKADKEFDLQNVQLPQDRCRTKNVIIKIATKNQREENSQENIFPGFDKMEISNENFSNESNSFEPVQKKSKLSSSNEDVFKTTVNSKPPFCNDIKDKIFQKDDREHSENKHFSQSPDPSLESTFSLKENQESILENHDCTKKEKRKMLYISQLPIIHSEEYKQDSENKQKMISYFVKRYREMQNKLKKQQEPPTKCNISENDIHELTLKMSTNDAFIYRDVDGSMVIRNAEQSIIINCCDQYDWYKNN